MKALITGASSGIGAALARRMAGRGVELWLAARRTERLQEVVRAIETAGGRAHALALDVGDGAATAAAVARLDDDVGGLDCVIANAGVGGRTTQLTKTSFDDAEEVIRTNVTGAIATLLPMMTRMAQRGRGQLVGISSLAAEVPLPAGVPYGASKAALTFFLQGAAMDLQPRGVDVTIVHPGFVKSEMTAKNRFPMPFLLEVDDAARIIDDGIVARRRMVRFPFGLAAMIQAARALPDGARAAFVARNAPKG